MRRLAAVIALIWLAHLQPAVAQGDVPDDVMEVQRCIWRCLSNSRGADDPAYTRCVDRLCSGKTEKRKPSKRRSEAPRPGVWTYGEHPRLGLSAYVEVGDEALGIACPAPRAEPHGYAVSMRMTGGFSPSKDGAGTITYLWTRPFAVGGQSIIPAVQKGLHEIDSDYCSSNVAQLRSSGALLLVREKFVSLSFDKRRTRMALEGDGGGIAIETAKDVAKLDRPLEVPLEGAKSAIDRLARACPSLRRQMAESCEVD